MRTRDQIKADKEKRKTALQAVKTKAQKRAFIKTLKDAVVQLKAELAEIKQKRGNV